MPKTRRPWPAVVLAAVGSVLLTVAFAGAAVFVAGIAMLDRAGTPLRRPGRSRPA